MSDHKLNSLEQKIYFAERFHSPVMAWVILAISLVLTITAYFVSRQLVAQRLSDQFEFRANEISRAIEDRLHIYEQALKSGVALFYASEGTHVERQQWANYVGALNLDENWPGIQGMGYSVPVKPEDKQTHINAIRAEGFNGYTIKPETERDEYSAIIYLEPFDWRNKRAFGYDMWSNAMRREAMARARDEGVAATSGMITLVQETDDDVQRGFLTYVPVYRGGRTPETLTERREQFQGWVYAAFRAANLMKGILGGEDDYIVFDVYDGKQINSESLLYSSLNHTEHNLDVSTFSQIRSIDLQGRLWTVVFHTPEHVVLADESNVPTFVVFGGFIIDIMLFYVLLSLNYINRRAENIAEEMTQELRMTKESLETEVAERTKDLSLARDQLDEKVRKRTAELQDKMHEQEKMYQLTLGRELRVVELKQEVNALVVELGRTPPYEEDEQSDMSAL